jgi:hypothetical protein
MTTPVLYPGTIGSVIFNSVDLRVQKWTFGEKGTVNETTTKSDGGYYKGVVTKMKGAGSFEAIYDSTINGGTVPPLKIGSQASANFQFDTGGVQITCPIITITDCDYTSDRDGMLTYTCTYETYGTYTLPTQLTS